MKTQFPVEIIPEGFYCYQIIKMSAVEENIIIKLCPYLVLDEENQIKYCKLLNNVEIGDFKECQIKLGVC